LGFFYRTILKGLFTLLPLSLTIYLLVWIATETEQLFGEPLRIWFPSFFGFTGAGFLVGMTFVFLVGFAVNSYLTQRFVTWLEDQIGNLPVVRTIYGPIRDVTNLFARQGAASSQRVVMVQLSQNHAENSTELLGLITRDTFSDLPAGVVNTGSVSVFIPLSYGMGGMTILVPRTKVREIPIPAERAMQLAITGWIKSSK
jgi:uncharacterized membrane protein